MEKAELTLNESWAVLGWNAVSIISHLKDIQDPQARVEMAEKMLKNAKRISRKTLAKNHPDLNPGSVEHANKFKMINKAIRSLEIYTQDMRKKFEASKNREPSKDRIYFK